MEINRLDVDCLGKGKILTKVDAEWIRALKEYTLPLFAGLPFLPNNKQKHITIRRPVKCLS